MNNPSDELLSTGADSAAGKPMPVRVYSPQSHLRHPGALLVEMFRDLFAARELGWRLFLRNLNAMYRQSILGVLWAFIPPIMTTLVWVFLRGQNVVSIADPPIPYTAFVMTGTMLWQLFFQSLQVPMNSIRQAKSMLIKLNFPREAVVIAGMSQVIFNFLIQLCLLIPIYLYYGVPLGSGLLFAPLGIAALICMGLALGLFVAPVGLLYTDVGKALSLMGPFWMLLTPVIYPPEPDGLAGKLAIFNPVSPVLTTTRDWLSSQPPTFLSGFMIVVAGTVVVGFVGWVLLRISMPILIERTGN